MLSRSFFHVSKLFLLFSVLCAHAQSDKPNVLFICIDDLVPTLGCYGDTTAVTPKIDSLASQGLTFLNHHCTWAVCGPSRAALTTGLAPEETGVMGFKAIRHPDRLPDVTTLPQHFKNNGYETACTGKFHDNRTVGDTTQTFDTGSEQYPDGSNVDDPASWSIGYVKAGSGINPTAPNGKKYATDDSDLPDSDYGDHKILTEGLTLINTLSAGNKPFFLAVGFKKPHLAFVAPKRFWDKYDRNTMPLATTTTAPTSASSQLASAFNFNNETLGYEPFFSDNSLLNDPAHQRELIHGYYACTSFIDDLVGQLVDRLAITNDPIQESSPGVKKKMSETTIIVLWGDHGFHLGDHGRWGKHNVMDRATLCPLIIYDPRSPNNGAKTNTPVNTLDIYPTLCELAGLPIPSQPIDKNTPTGRPLKGRSLVPILDDPSDTSVHVGSLNLFQQSGAYGYSYRTERFRYIEWVNGSGTVVGRDLYDYQNDPLATKNLAADPAYETIVYQLSRSMRAEPSWRGPDYDGNTNRLHSSAAISTGGTGTLPFLGIQDAGNTDFTLSWPGSSGVCYEVLSSTTLQTGSWSSHVDHLTGSSHTMAINDNRRFFAIQFGSNTPPYWLQDPVTRPDASTNVAYSGHSLAGLAADPDSGATLTFSKVNGPSWLTVGSDGTLGGTPSAADEEAAYFTVRVTDNHGVSVDARLQITVAASAPPSSANFVATHDTYGSENNVTLVPGTRKFMEVRQIGASNFERIAFLKFSVAGVGSVQSAKLWIYVDGSGTNPEGDTVRAYQVADNTWDESTLNWNNKPAHGASIGSASAPGGTGGWFSIDVASYITGNGTFSIALDEGGNSVGRLVTKEESSAAFAPYLEVTWQ